MSSGFKPIENFAVAKQLLCKLLVDPLFEKNLFQAVEILVQVFRSGGQVYSCGNGGSMCDAMHFAEELTGQFKKARPALPAISFSDVSALSCIANDFGYADIFARMVEAYGHSGHALLAISTSGNSPNILRAAKKAKELGLFVIGLSGESGGQLKEFCQPCFLVPSASSDRIQEVHIKILHTLIEGVERELFPQNYL